MHLFSGDLCACLLVFGWCCIGRPVCRLFGGCVGLPVVFWFSGLSWCMFFVALGLLEDACRLGLCLFGKFYFCLFDFAVAD